MSNHLLKTLCWTLGLLDVNAHPELVELVVIVNASSSARGQRLQIWGNTTGNPELSK